MKTFRDALAEIIATRGLQQMDVAIRGDVSESSISHYLAGTRKPQPQTIAKIADGLELEPAYFKEFRYHEAHRMIECALDDDIIELTDLERFLKVAKAGRQAGA